MLKWQLDVSCYLGQCRKGERRWYSQEHRGVPENAECRKPGGNGPALIDDSFLYTECY